MANSFDNFANAGFSPACERNKEFILDVLREHFAGMHSILEIGSGTGQHVVHFARALPELVWQPADQSTYLPGLRARLHEEAPANVKAALELDVRKGWPAEIYDGVFSANTLHYMGADCVESFFAGVGRVLRPGGRLVVYGPFRYGGMFTSESNARFDRSLREGDPVRGIRDFEWVAKLAAAQQMQHLCDLPMPANNQALVWVKQTAT